MKLFSIIKKNFKIFIRSKISALVVFLGPLLLVSLIGMSFSNTQMSGITVGTYSPDYNDFTNSIISKIEDNKFVINKFDSKQLCSDSVKKGDASICLVFPEKMDQKNNEVTFIVDYSKINLVWVVVDIFSNKVSERATELRYNYATDLLSKVIKTKEDLFSQKTKLDSLTAKQTSSKDSIDSAKSILDEINPTTNLGEKTTKAAVMASIDKVAGAVSSAKTKITSAMSSVSDSGLSDNEKDDINDDLANAYSSLSTATLYLEGNSSTSSLEFMVLDLESALSNAKSQLQIIKSKKESVSGELLSLESDLNSASSIISELKTITNGASERIANVQSSDAEQLVSPIKTKIEPVTTKETHFNYLFPTLIVMIIMVTAILLSSTLVMNEKKSKSLFRNYITPTSDLMFNLGTFLTAFIAIAVQLIIFLVVASLFFGTDIAGTLGSSSIAIMLIMSVFILLGMMIGYIFKSEETYVLASVTVASLLMFLSSTVMPIESISDSVRQFASATPFVVSENALRQIMFFNFNLSSLIAELCILLGYAVVFAGVIFGIQKLARQNISIIKKREVKKQP